MKKSYIVNFIMMLLVLTFTATVLNIHLFDICLDYISHVEYIQEKEVALLMQLQNIDIVAQREYDKQGSTIYQQLHSIYDIKGKSDISDRLKVMHKRINAIKQSNQSIDVNKEYNSFLTYLLLGAVRSKYAYDKFFGYNAAFALIEYYNSTDWTVSADMTKTIEDLSRMTYGLYKKNKFLADRPLIGGCIMMRVNEKSRDQRLKYVLNEQLNKIKKEHHLSYICANLFTKLSNIFGGSSLHSKHKNKGG